jgi:hypothetical protein
VSDGKLRFYYWHIMTALAENAEFLNSEAIDHHPPDEFLVESRGHIEATIVFKNGSRLIARAELDVTTEVQEYDYAYVYLDPDGERVLQYDDAPHHLEIPTHPHHMHKGKRPIEGRDQAYALDIPRVDFVTVFTTIIRDYLHRDH